MKKWLIWWLLPLAVSAGCADGGERKRCVIDQDCPDGMHCLAGECSTHDPCENVKCQPDEECVLGECVKKGCTATSCTEPPGRAACYDLPAPCIQGVCDYRPVVGRGCDDGDLCTEDDTCTSAGLCAGQQKPCPQEPDVCLDDRQLRRCLGPGACENGSCVYRYETYDCPDGCRDGACLGCQPEWVDTSGCDCTPGPCAGCSGQKTQSDGCGNSRQVACTLDATGCPQGEVCHLDSCCRPNCTGKACGSDGCGGICGGCQRGEGCILDRCAPLAILLGAEGNSPSGWCPVGYRLAGRWRTGPFSADGQMEGVDFHRYKIDAGWMWLCSADTSRVKIVAVENDCGTTSGGCAGWLRGAWHVGAGCGTLSAVDEEDRQLEAGWLGLCVAGDSEVLAETAHNDCGPAGPGCQGRRNLGSWHTSPAACGAGDTGVGASGASIETGWMVLCLDSDNFPPVATDSLTGKALAGYQGWFATPADGSAWNSWVHWFRSQTPTAENATFDLWPDLSEYEADELYPTSMTYADGRPAGLYSAYREKTVRRHFRWMAEYGIDGVFLQRFLHEAVMPVPGAFRDQVTRNVIAAAEAYGRVFVIEYDISGSTDDMLPEALIQDWKHLVDDLGVTRSPRYLHHLGRPLVGVWGIGFSDRAGSPEDIAALVDFFHNTPDERYRATVMGGVPEGWRTSSGSSKPGFTNAYRLYDVINPWMVGRFGDEAGVASFDRDFIEPDLALCRQLGRDYLPVLFPGFSWANLMQNPGLLNQIPRRGGSFYWRQFYEFLGSGCDMLFLAMFDEVDEGTAILKAAATQGELPQQGRFLALDQDGLSVPNDWYLRLAGAGWKTLSGQLPRQAGLPLK